MPLRRNAWQWHVPIPVDPRLLADHRPETNDEPYYIKFDVISVNNEVAGGTFTTAVPEPASWAMILAGFGALGLALRRRATQNVTLAA